MSIIPKNKYKAVGERVVVQRILKHTMTTGGLHIPIEAQRTTNTGTVLDIGPKCTADIKKGDVVRYKKIGGITLEKLSDKTEIAVIRGNEIECVLY